MNNGLPKEIIIEIISFLPFRDTGRIRRTCKLLSMIPFENRYTKRNTEEVTRWINNLLVYSTRFQYPIKQWLLSCIIFTNITNYTPDNLAVNIVMLNDIKLIQRLLLNISAPTYIFVRCLYFAIPRGYTDIVRLVLPRAYVTQSNFRMAIDGGYIEIVRLLANPTYNYENLIKYAQRQGKLEIVHLLQTFSGSPGSTNPAAPSCPPPL
jgi:hypothetical protein